MRLSLLGAAAGAGVSAEGPVVSRTNYLVGQPEDWLQEVPSYAAVRYSGVYDGIDLRYYGNEQRLEYDFIVAPGADWRQIGMRFDGALGVSVSEDGALLLSLAGTGGRTIRFEASVSYQEGPDGREAVESRYVLAEDGSVRSALRRHGSFSRRAAGTGRPIACADTTGRSRGPGGMSRTPGPTDGTPCWWRVRQPHPADAAGSLSPSDSYLEGTDDCLRASQAGFRSGVFVR